MHTDFWKISTCVLCGPSPVPCHRSVRALGVCDQVPGKLVSSNVGAGPHESVQIPFLDDFAELVDQNRATHTTPRIVKVVAANHDLISDQRLRSQRGGLPFNQHFLDKSFCCIGRQIPATVRSEGLWVRKKKLECMTQ